MIWLNVFKIAVIAVTPTLIGAAFIYGPRWWGAVRRRLPERDPGPQPLGPPIEQLAADLRRLLRLHNEVVSSAHLAFCAQRVWSLEVAIGVRAIEAARALDVPHKEPEVAGTMPRGELCGLLHALADAGLVLPAAVGTFTKNGRL